MIFVFSKMIVKYYEICDKIISLKNNDDKLNLKQRILRFFIEPACGTIEGDEYETRSEPVLRVAFEK